MIASALGPIPNLEPSLAIHPYADAIFVGGMLAFVIVVLVVLWRLR